MQKIELKVKKWLEVRNQTQHSFVEEHNLYAIYGAYALPLSHVAPWQCPNFKLNPQNLSSVISALNFITWLLVWLGNITGHYCKLCIRSRKLWNYLSATTLAKWCLHLVLQLSWSKSECTDNLFSYLLSGKHLQDIGSWTSRFKDTAVRLKERLFDQLNNLSWW